MKVWHDCEGDVLRILFNDAPIAESDEAKPGAILDYAEDGGIVAMEILDALKHISNPSWVEYAVIGVESA